MAGLETLAGVIPTTVGGVVGLVIQLVIVWVAIVVADKIIAHNIEPKRSFILAILAYFISPLVLAFAQINIPYAAIVVPLIVWIVLGELLLKRDRAKDRLKVAVVAFIIYLILSFAGVPALIGSAIKV